MDFNVILGFWLMAILTSVSYKNLAVGMIEEIGINQRYYPHKYIKPKKWIKKLFKIKRGMIPRYLYFDLFLSIIFAILGPINTIIYLCFDNIGGWLVMFHAALAVCANIHFCIISMLFKKRR